MATDAEPIRPDRSIDCIGLFCPMPIVRTRDAIRAMTVGQVLEMLSDDPGSDPDMKMWAQRSGHDLIQVFREGAVFRFLVRKTH